MHTENPGNPVPTTPPSNADLHHVKDSEHPGYETTDVNVGGVLAFLGGLMVFIVVFFLFCFFMGKVINTQFAKDDGKADRWHKTSDMFAGAAANGGKRDNLASAADIEQKQLATMTQSFPNPRLDTDDGNQATAELHAKEDLLLEHYSRSETGVRIPIERAMELIAEKGLPVAPVVETKRLAEDVKPQVLTPLTTGFARTGYELGTIETREQKMNFNAAKAEAK